MAVVEESVMSPDALPSELEYFVSEDYEDGAPPAPPVDPSLAPRIARRRARIEASIAERRASVKAEIERLLAWQAHLDARESREASRLDEVLKAILDAERERDPRKKTLTLPYGVTVASRKVPASIKRDTKAAAINRLIVWCDDDRYIDRQPTLRWERLKQDLRVTEDGRVVHAETGEAVPPECGITYEPEHESVTVKVSTEGTDA